MSKLGFSSRLLESMRHFLNVCMTANLGISSPRHHGAVTGDYAPAAVIYSGVCLVQRAFVYLSKHLFALIPP